jgi:hypothetical protein
MKMRLAVSYFSSWARRTWRPGGEFEVAGGGAGFHFAVVDEDFGARGVERMETATRLAAGVELVGWGKRGSA